MALGGKPGAEGDVAGDAMRVLERLEQGDETAAQELLPLVYGELRALAGAFMRGERPEHTLQPTALVHEAYLRLVRSHSQCYHDRKHFVAVAARAMRRVLVDHARARGRDKRDGRLQRLTLAELDAPAARDPRLDVDVQALHQALGKLERVSARQVRIVELRYFGGMTVAEIAETLGLGKTTVQDDWAHARAWLYRELAS